jgi:hypothetical protein
VSADDLLRSGRLERVPADLGAAMDRLAACEQHLRSADLLADDDPVMAYAALYDAARKAVTAHMLANGVRAANRAGAHEAVGLYAASELSDPTGSALRFQAMRLKRNRSEYHDVPVGQQEVVADLSRARDIVAAVRGALEAQVRRDP